MSHHHWHGGKRQSRSSFQVTSTSPARTKAKASRKPSRSTWAPEAWSSNTLPHPALVKASSCNAVSWSAVLTRA